MHRISDLRVGGIARNNFIMFRKLCGDENLRNVAIVTNMWGEVDVHRGEAREMQLRTEPLLFQPAVAQGAQMLRHLNTLASAQAIISHFIGNHPTALRIQRELVDEGKDISQTSAGQELDRELIALLEKHKAEMDELKGDMADAIAAKDAQTKRDVEAVQQDLQAKIGQLQQDRERISREYQDEKRRADERIRVMEEKIEGERKEREARAREIESIRETLQKAEKTSQAEREKLQSRIRELEAQTTPTFWSTVLNVASTLASMYVSGALNSLGERSYAYGF